MPSKIKDFLFKFIHNKLPTNTRLLHMTDEQIDRACTFCSATKQLPAPEEKFEHLFWHCPSTQYFSEMINEIIPEIQNFTHEQKKKILLYWHFTKSAFPDKLAANFWHCTLCCTIHSVGVPPAKKSTELDYL